jgi:hypothetical protein
MRYARNMNVGYVLFAFGLFCLVGVAATAASRTPGQVTSPGLNVSALPVPANLSGSGYDAF